MEEAYTMFIPWNSPSVRLTGRWSRLETPNSTNAFIAAKTGTAEVGTGETRRKNTWVIAFAPYENPTMAVALIVEKGESGGLTAAPKVHEVLASRFGEETP